jgi:hypothetical protein
MNRFPIFILPAALAVLLFGCSGVTEDVVQLHVPTGLGGILNLADTLVVSATGLQPGEFPVMIEAVAEDDTVASRVRLTADLDGRIDDVILAYDLGLADQPGDGALPPGVYTIRLISSSGTTQAQILVAQNPNRQAVWTCDTSGNLANGFETGQPVFVEARKLIAGKKYRIWPVVDRRSWSDGDTFESWAKAKTSIVWPPGLPEYIEITAPANGILPATTLLPFATKQIPGVTDHFDVILDAAPYGVFNTTTDAVDGGLPTGAVIQDHNTGAPYITELACRKDGVYTNTFTAPEPVYIWLNPGVQILTPHAYVYKYIVPHRTEWLDGDAIEDITGGAESDAVQFGCANEGLVLVWAESLVGEYDAVIDMNGNGVYDEGTDILDGGPVGPGFKVVAQ